MGFDIKTRLSMLKSSAKARGLFVNLDLNKYQTLIDYGCHFCGNDLKNENGYCLDRIDSQKNYIISNVVPCCKVCNRAKSNMNYHDFLDWIEKAANHMKLQKQNMKELEELRITQELYIELEEALYKELHKNKPRNRLFFNPNKG